MAGQDYPLGEKRLNKLRQILDRYYEGVSMDTLAVEVNWSVRTLEGALTQYHKQFDTVPRRANTRMSIEADADLILERLVTQSMKTIAYEYGVSPKTLREALMDLGKWKGTPVDQVVQRVSLNDLKHGAWMDIEEDTILTVGRVDRFLLIPLEK